MYSTDVREQIVARFNAGETKTVLATSFSCNERTITRFLRIAGVEISPTRNGNRSKRFRIDASSAKTVRISPKLLAAARLDAGLTQYKLAQLIGCPKVDLIRQWERGERRISGDYLIRFLLVTRCLIDTICEIDS